METITIQANESFIKEIKALIKEKAKALNEQVSFKGDPIKEEILEDVREYKKGTLQTEPLGTNWKYL